MYTRGYQKFVDRCDEINSFLSYAYKFCRKHKTTNIIFQLWTCKLDMLIIIHFIIKYNLYGMVTRRNLCCELCHEKQVI